MAKDESQDCSDQAEFSVEEEQCNRDDYVRQDHRRENGSQDDALVRHRTPSQDKRGRNPKQHGQCRGCEPHDQRAVHCTHIGRIREEYSVVFEGETEWRPLNVGCFRERDGNDKEGWSRQIHKGDQPDCPKYKARYRGTGTIGLNGPNPVQRLACTIADPTQ